MMLYAKKIFIATIAMIIALFALISCTFYNVFASAESVYYEYVSYNTSTQEVIYYDVSSDENLNTSENVNEVDTQPTGGENDFFNPSDDE